MLNLMFIQDSAFADMMFMDIWKMVQNVLSELTLQGLFSKISSHEEE